MQQPLETRSRHWAKERHSWHADLVEATLSKIEVLSPSELAESVRYLPQSNTTLPGYFRFDVCPYMREPADCLGVDSPIREIAVMKGVQICATTALLENGVLYGIAHVKNVPMMFATSTIDLATTRLNQFILPMLQQSKLGHLIQSSDEDSSQKKGKTKTRIEFQGGGYMQLIGANSPSAMRSLPIKYLFRDEIDDWPDAVGKDGDPLALTGARTKTFEDNRKILDLSTPNLKGKSKIEKQFLRGDQRHYFVCCLGCGYSQTLAAYRTDPDNGLYGWRHTDPNTGEVTGFVWDTDEHGKLIPGSTRWLCHKCGHSHTNDDKSRLLSPEFGAEWRPTAVPEAPSIRSYHIAALYSPVGMQSWDACVSDWLAAWDPQRNAVRDTEKLKVFYNNILGLSFAEQGDKLTKQIVSSLRRDTYRFGEIPNKWLKQVTGSSVLFTVCTVDVHKNNLAVARWGWCSGFRVVLLDYERLHGNTEDIQDEGTWGELEKRIQSGYVADDGKQYGIELALVDAGYLPDQVRMFCDKMGAGVFPTFGRGRGQAGGNKLFTESSTISGTHYLIGVDLYKDRWGAALKRGWVDGQAQPSPFFNAPFDIKDPQLKELTVESKQSVKNVKTGEIVYWTWHRPNGADNELWDLLVYANTAHDILCHSFLESELEITDVDDDARRQFWEICEQHAIFYST